MYKIVEKKYLTDVHVKMSFHSPQIARKIKPGQFVIIRVDERGERIPLTMAGADPEKGTVTVIFQVVGVTTRKLAAKEVGEEILDLVGPLGNPAEIEKVGTVCVVVGGVGAAVGISEVKAFKECGNRVITILGARSADLLLLEDELREYSDELIITTDDGSKGIKGVVTQPLAELLEKEKLDLVVAIGPVIMMKFVVATTKPKGVRTIVSLNPIMVDGTGMCGACRVTVDGKTRFACVDGPEFDGFGVDFDELMNRLNFYKEEEQLALKLYEESLKGE